MTSGGRDDAKPDRTPIACMDDDFMPFGKHKGTIIGLMDIKYMGWLSRQEFCKDSWPRIYWWCVLNRERFEGVNAVSLDAAYAALGDVKIRQERTRSPKQPMSPESVTEMRALVDTLIDTMSHLSSSDMVEHAYPDEKYREAILSLRQLNYTIMPGSFESNWRKLDSEGRSQILQLAMLTLKGNPKVPAARQQYMHELDEIPEADLGF